MDISRVRSIFSGTSIVTILIALLVTTHAPPSPREGETEREGERQRYQYPLLLQHTVVYH